MAVIRKAAGYADSEQQLAHSSVHRWFGSFGGMTQAMARAQALILQKDPASTVCRDAPKLSVYPGKYRSRARKSLLERVIRLFFVNGVYCKMFYRSIFPTFATGPGFT